MGGMGAAAQRAFKAWTHKVVVVVAFRLVHPLDSWGATPVSMRTWAMECQGALHVLQIMSMACPRQASGLQGSRRVTCGTLAVKYLGIGSGWQQSKQYWVPLAVEGQQARMRCSDLCCAELVQLRLFYILCNTHVV